MNRYAIIVHRSDEDALSIAEAPDLGGGTLLVGFKPEIYDEFFAGA